MNSKQFGKILIIVLVIGGIGFFLNKNRQSDWRDSSAGAGDKVLGEFDANEVASLTIKTSEGELNVEKKDDRWTVKEREGYPAKFSSVFDFLRKVEELKIVQKEQIGESQFARMEVNEPGADAGAGTLVDLKSASGESLKTMILGKEQMKKGDANSPFGANDMAVGRWVLNPDDKENILLVSETFSSADTAAKDWVNKDFFGVSKLKTIDVVSSSNEFTWNVVREAEGGDWKLQGKTPAGKEIDSSKISSIGNPLGSPSFQDVIVGKKAEDTGLDKPTKITLTTFEGFKYDVKVGKQTEDNDYYFQVNVSANIDKKRTPGKDEKEEDKAKLDQEFADSVKKLEEKLAKEQVFNKWTYLVSKWTVDSFFKQRSDFFKDQEAKKDDASVSIPNTPTPLLPPSITPPPPVPTGNNAKATPATKGTETKADTKPAVTKTPPAPKSTPKPSATKAPAPKKPAAKKPAPKKPATKQGSAKAAPKKPEAKKETTKPAAKKPESKPKAAPKKPAEN
ncbi:MAG: hypothetical protein CMO80_24635 [Verrucomicrobiales bacterium]|nr:hypothetical protein [Verrucomicrobiales bacterium]|tara:strand:- start:7687 stop:9210 length:1524 start_codon:yes stop_codon:yes gene_type:complete